jgi:hypothetical protein
MSPALPRRTLRRHVFRVVAGAGGVLLLMGIDWYVQNDSMDRFVTAAENAEIEMAAFTVAVGEFVQETGPEGPSRTTVDAFSDAATDVAERLEGDCLVLAETAVLPWHTTLRQARDQFHGHCRAWLVFVSAAAQDWRHLTSPPAEISSSFTSARDAALAAVPPAPLHDVDGRVDRLFRE